MRDAVRRASAPVMDTTGPGDISSLSAIHLDPPAAVPARGTGRWLGPRGVDVVIAMCEAARIGQPGGLNMIEVRHADTASVGQDGAFTTVPGSFLMHAVGAAADDDARGRVDAVLHDVETAAGSADIGHAAAPFREGQPDTADAVSPSTRERLRAVRSAVDPDGVLVFHRQP